MKRPRNITRQPLILILAVVNLMILSKPFAFSQVNSTWSSTGSLSTPRHGHTATLLPNGKILVAGGEISTAPYVTASAELYDPATGVWSVTGSLNMPRSGHTATLLSNGKVLVAGGDTSATPPDFGLTKSAELFDPATGTWSITESLNVARSWYTATVLQNGKVLAVGGGGCCGDNSAELYDPATGAWSLTGSLISGRYGQTATLLQNGKVLVVGGSDDSDLDSTLASAELYDPATEKWSVISNLNASHIFHTATLLPDGRVLVTGGYTVNWVPANGGFASSPTSLNGAELYDPATGTWSATDNLNEARDGHTATLLPSGKVLVAGGEIWTTNGSTPNDGTYPCGVLGCTSKTINVAELYDPATGTWSATTNLNAARNGHTATLLPSGKVLVAGGQRNGVLLDSAELYDDSSLPLQFGATTLATGEAGVSFTTDLGIFGGVAPYIVAINRGALPQGLSLGNDGIISGIPTRAKRTNITVRVTDAVNESVTKAFRITILRAVVIRARVSTARIGKNYRASFKTRGGHGPFNWSMTSGTLPTGLNFDNTTATITGIPAETGECPLIVQVTDALGGVATVNLTLTVK